MAKNEVFIVIKNNNNSKQISRLGRLAKWKNELRGMDNELRLRGSADPL
jgi:hypothetical protein